MLITLILNHFWMKFFHNPFLLYHFGIHYFECGAIACVSKLKSFFFNAFFDFLSASLLQLAAWDSRSLRHVLALEWSASHSATFLFKESRFPVSFSTVTCWSYLTLACLAYYNILSLTQQSATFMLRAFTVSYTSLKAVNVSSFKRGIKKSSSLENLSPHWLDHATASWPSAPQTIDPCRSRSLTTTDDNMCPCDLFWGQNYLRCLFPLSPSYRTDVGQGPQRLLTRFFPRQVWMSVYRRMKICRPARDGWGSINTKSGAQWTWVGSTHALFLRCHTTSIGTQIEILILRGQTGYCVQMTRLTWHHSQSQPFWGLLIFPFWGVKIKQLMWSSIGI